MNLEEKERLLAEMETRMRKQYGGETLAEAEDDDDGEVYIDETAVDRLIAGVRRDKQTVNELRRRYSEGELTTAEAVELGIV